MHGARPSECTILAAANELSSWEIQRRYAADATLQHFELAGKSETIDWGPFHRTVLEDCFRSAVYHVLETFRIFAFALRLLHADALIHFLSMQRTG